MHHGEGATGWRSELNHQQQAADLQHVTVKAEGSCQAAAAVPEATMLSSEQGRGPAAAAAAAAGDMMAGHGPGYQQLVDSILVEQRVQGSAMIDGHGPRYQQLVDSIVDGQSVPGGAMRTMEGGSQASRHMGACEGV